MADYAAPDTPQPESDINEDVLACLQRELSQSSGEVGERNDKISRRDGYIYGDLLERNLDIPLGHDHTNVNWLRRTVEIHKTQFMGRPFQVLSTYDTKSLSMVTDPSEGARIEQENKRQKQLAELRKKTIDDIIRDNGGHSLFADGAESASAIGNFIIKMFYDDDAKKIVLSPIESVENCWAVWEADDFRKLQVFAYVYQVTPQQAAQRFGLKEEDIHTSPEGSPFIMPNASGNLNNNTGSTSLNQNRTGTNQTYTGRPMVTVLEATGRIPGYGSDNGKPKKVTLGKENDVNVLYVGQHLIRLIDDPKKLPKYYVFPNKKVRRRAWGESDISDAAIQINATYVETLSDWRTVQMKVNFPKFRGFNFGPDTTMPKMQNRKVQFLPLGPDQDVQPLNQGDANGLEFQKMLDEIKEQFVRETGISRVLFDDPSITLNSNQALLTSMKPTSDIAENKKQLWAPVLVEMFEDALELAAANLPGLEDLTSEDFGLKVQWPSVMQKEDPVFQQMLLNRKNAGTISLQSYLEMQGESSEEVDRIRDEMSDPITAAILSNSLPVLYRSLLPQPGLQAEATAGVPQQTANPTVATPANNTPGAGVVSQPGSGQPTPVAPQGALNQVSQNLGA